MLHKSVFLCFDMYRDHLTLLILIVLSPHRSCQEVEIVLCQLTASCIASVGIEGKVGHEVVGDGIADELAGDLVEVGNEEVRL